MFRTLIVGTMVLTMGGIFLSLFSTDITAASFECNPALSRLPKSANISLSPIERFICDNPQASQLDERLAGLYWLAKQLSSKREQVISEQKKWISQKRDICKTTDCVIGAQEERYRELKKQLAARLRSLPQESFWEYSTPWEAAPDSYCVKFGDKKKTRDVFGIFLMFDKESVCGKGYAIIDCGRKIQDISPIKGHVEDDIVWIEFDGQFGQPEPSKWRALIAFDGKKLYWKIVRKTEVESYIGAELHLGTSINSPSDVEMNELKESCSRKVK